MQYIQTTTKCNSLFLIKKINFFFSLPKQNQKNKCECISSMASSFIIAMNYLSLLLAINKKAQDEKIRRRKKSFLQVIS